VRVLHPCSVFLEVYSVLCLFYLTSCVCVCHLSHGPFAGVPSSQALPGFLVTAPPPVLVSDASCVHSKPFCVRSWWRTNCVAAKHTPKKIASITFTQCVFPPLWLFFSFNNTLRLAWTLNKPTTTHVSTTHRCPRIIVDTEVWSFPDEGGGGALWITFREVPYWGSAAVLSPMLAYVDLQTPPPARPATVTDDIRRPLSPD